MKTLDCEEGIGKSMIFFKLAPARCSLMKNTVTSHTFHFYLKSYLASIVTFEALRHSVTTFFILLDQASIWIETEKVMTEGKIRMKSTLKIS